jgi:hypothetical protein
MALALKISMFDSFDQHVKNYHQPPRGCMNDFCKDKREIGFKLRSADICPDCLKIIRDKGVNQLLVQQVFSVIDDIRKQLLFRERFTLTHEPSRMKILGRTKRIFLVDLGDLEILLTPLEKTVYLFFLNHQEGVEFSSMPDHFREIRQLYGNLSNTDIVANLENRASSLCRNDDDCLSQIISRIRRKFENTLGAELAKPFLISGESGHKRRIGVDKKYVELIE